MESLEEIKEKLRNQKINSERITWKCEGAIELIDSLSGYSLVKEKKSTKK
tara:strand:- start:1676 stop:1825 length:150 start_codon:yes stop_codon:yes gene_type:complete